MYLPGIGIDTGTENKHWKIFYCIGKGFTSDSRELDGNPKN